VPDHALHVLDLGALELPTEHVVWMGGSERIVVPIPGFVITHPGGNVLFDSGFPKECLTDPKHFGESADVYDIRMKPENHVLEQLKLAGVDPDSIRFVVQTHLHWDHVGGIGQFPNAEFLVHQDDWDFAHNTDWYVEFAYPLGDIDRPGVRWTYLTTTPDGPMHDLYGDGRIRLQVSPGHSPGQLSLIARLDDSTVMLTGDAANSIEHYEYRALPFYVDSRALTRSVDRLHRLEASEDVDLVLFGHDAQQFPTLKKGADFYV
jgi:glyoxylase-like metal-dependent hydrolase (beta-lactamase superfamily II)